MSFSVILAWLVDSKAGRIVAGVFAVIVLFATFYWKAFSDGKSSEKTKQTEASLENMRSREKTDESIEILSDTERRHHLREWVPNDDK